MGSHDTTGLACMRHRWSVKQAQRGTEGHRQADRLAEELARFIKLSRSSFFGLTSLADNTAPVGPLQPFSHAAGWCRMQLPGWM